MLGVFKIKSYDLILIHLMYALGLRIWKVKFLRCYNVMNTDKVTIKVYDMKKRKINVLKYLKNSLMK